jgi:hypothetical protein
MPKKSQINEYSDSSLYLQYALEAEMGCEVK